jgi:hypothetical protein
MPTRIRKERKKYERKGGMVYQVKSVLSSMVNARYLKKNVRPFVASYRAHLARNLRHLSRREWRDFVKRRDVMTRMYLHGIHADENPDTLHPNSLPPDNLQSTILIFFL